MVTMLEEFTMALDVTSEAWASGERKRIDATRLRSHTKTYLEAAHAADDLIGGGDKIHDTIYLDEKTTFQRHGANPKIEYPQEQTGTPWDVPWAMATQTMGWNEHTLAVNERLREEYRAEAWKNIIWLEMQRAYLDLNKQIELEYWAPPNALTQEAVSPSGVRAPYPLGTLISEFPNTLPPGFTTIMQINPTTTGLTGWKNQVGTYAWTNATAGVYDKNLQFVQGLLRMKQLTHFMPIPMNPEYSQPTVTPTVIFCSHWGERLVSHFMTANQDTFWGFSGAKGQDAAYANLQYFGIPIVAIEQLNTAMQYSVSGTSLGTEASATVAGPRFIFVNGYSIKPFKHRSMNFSESPPINPTDYPYSVARIVKVMNNVFVNNRRENGVLSPAASVTDFA